MWKKEEEAGEEDDYIVACARARRFEFVCMHAIHWAGNAKFCVYDATCWDNEWWNDTRRK